MNELSFKAIGLYATIKHMNSIGENVTLESLSKKGSDGINSIRTGLKELIETGYIARVVFRNGNLVCGSTYEILKPLI